MEKRVQALPRGFYLRTQEKVCGFGYVSTESIHRGTFMPAKCLIARYIAGINGRIINEKSQRDIASKLLSSTDTS